MLPSGVKKSTSSRNNKSNKKLMRIISADSKRTLEDIDVPNEVCQNFNVNKNLKLKEIDVDTTEDMLFPIEVNKYLKEKVDVLTEENGRLQRSLEESEAQLKALELKCPPALHGRASDLAASKIVELSKKVRELTAELEVTKLRARNAENQSQQKTIKEVLPEEKENDKTESVLNAEVKDLTEKLNSTNLKLCESRNQIQQLKHELKMTQKALSKEVGQNVSVQSILSGKGWRGRAQQICGLQQRVTQLSEKLANHEQGSSTAVNDSIATIRQVEKDLRAELTHELTESRKDLDQMKSKWAAAKARCRVLENDLMASKDKISTLLEKTSHDDQLVTVLSNQIRTLAEKHKEEQHGVVKRMEQNIVTLENNFATEKTRNDQLQTILEHREEQISELQEKIKTILKHTEENGPEKLQNSRADSANCTTNGSNMNDGINQNSAQDPFGQLAEAERVRLLELIQVLNKRLDSHRQNSLQTEEELRLERQRAAKLETRVARLELERVGAEKPSNYSVRCSSNIENSANEKAKEKIQLLEETCAALKMRLQCVTQEKEDDLCHMICLLDEAKKSFMDAMRRTSP